MNKEILCTLGPSSLNDRVIARLAELGVSLFRLNLSHLKLSQVAGIIEFVQSRTTVPLCLDTEGAQIRTSDLADGVTFLKENSILHIHKKPVPGDSHDFNLYPADIVERLALGDFISIDNSALLQIIDLKREGVTARVLNGGRIGQNKAVTVDRDIWMPPLTEKDISALAIGNEAGIRHVALSFANHASDVEKIRELACKDAFVFSKIECLNGLTNLSQIAACSDAILIDRGDLSRQVPVEQIPALQKRIIRCGKEAAVKVYVATNLMESMVKEPDPTRAEVNDVFNTLADGADGLVLAAETAIGDYPIGCASMVVKLIREFENGIQSNNKYYPSAAISLLVDPHGGRLIHREAEASDISDLNRLKSFRVKDTDLMDCQQIALGTYSPVTGFMDRENLESVLNSNRLPDGLPWTMPLVLQASKNMLKNIVEGERVALSSSSGKIHAILDIAEIYKVNLEEVAGKWFNTRSGKHPGVSKLISGGDMFIGGNITLVEKLSSPFSQFELTPAQTRFIFTKKSWNKVVGFHTRNVPHRAHEYIQLNALESTHADGLFISPVIGPKKSGDFLPGPIMESYKYMIDFGLYPRGKVVLGCFSTYSRYCGPREAVFTAICRKNLGCSHFVIGRDHTGVGQYYKDCDIRKLFDSLGDIGVTPVFYDSIGYDPASQSYQSLSEEGTLPISGTEIRDALIKNGKLPEWLIREKIQDILLAEIASGKPVFHQ